jgi:hypothetical protein
VHELPSADIFFMERKRGKSGRLPVNLLVMAMAETLTDKTLATLSGLGGTSFSFADESVNVVISVSDKFGDTWTVIVAEDLEALAGLDPKDYSTSRFVLVVTQGQESEGRSKFVEREYPEEVLQPFVWCL